MTESIWPTIHAERRALADDLVGLSDADWATASLCEQWTVHDVLAHMVSAAKTTPPLFFGRLIGARFNFDRYVGKQVRVEGAGGPAATLAEFRAVEQRTAAPPGPKDTWLGEVLVHSEDIRRPLGIKHEYPLPMVARTLAFYTRSNAIIGGRDRVKGVTLEASDTDCTIGSGPRATGPAIALLLASTGRATVLDELAGPGVEVLRERM